MLSSPDEGKAGHFCAEIDYFSPVSHRNQRRNPPFSTSVVENGTPGQEYEKARPWPGFFGKRNSSSLQSYCTLAPRRSARRRRRSRLKASRVSGSPVRRSSVLLRRSVSLARS